MMVSTLRSLLTPVTCMLVRCPRPPALRLGAKCGSVSAHSAACFKERRLAVESLHGQCGAASVPESLILGLPIDQRVGYQVDAAVGSSLARQSSVHFGISIACEIDPSSTSQVPRP